eukprot:Colp12_sorted_trinity150504_noHs@14108
MCIQLVVEDKELEVYVTRIKPLIQQTNGILQVLLSDQRLEEDAMATARVLVIFTVLPRNWEGRGAPMARHVAKLTTEAVFKNIRVLRDPRSPRYIQLDDDVDMFRGTFLIEGAMVERDVDLGTGLVWLYMHFQFQEYEHAQMLSFSPARAWRIQGLERRPNGYAQASTRCEKVVMLRLSETTKRAVYARRSVRTMSDQEWTLLKDQPRRAHQDIFSREDFRLTEQIEVLQYNDPLLQRQRFRPCFLLPKVRALEVEVPTVNGTQTAKYVSTEDMAREIETQGDREWYLDLVLRKGDLQFEMPDVLAVD